MKPAVRYVTDVEGMAAGDGFVRFAPAGGGAAMDITVKKGEIFAPSDRYCPVEVKVTRGGHCSDLACCGQSMLMRSEEEDLDLYEREMRGECDHEEP